MTDITSTRMLYLKGFLFLFTGLMATMLLLFEHPELKVALLLAIAVWSFSRAYYFAFYVISHYIDSSFKFAGLGSFAVYIYKMRK